MHRASVMVVTAMVMAVLAGCGAPGAGKAEAVAKGRQIYNTGGASSVPCATCHTLDGSELVGPSFKGISQRAGSRVSGLSAQDYIRQSIMEPSAHVVEGYSDQMFKDYAKTLSKEDVDNVIAFLMTQ